MNIESIPYQAFPSIGYAINASQGGRMSVPVSPSSYIYSQFKHVSGTPAPEGVSGVNINKLKILDTLIEQISRLKKEPEPLIETQDQDYEKQINSRIEQYHNQLRTIQASNAGNPYAQAAPFAGALFSIAA
jgi:TolA-binding protein